MDKIQITFNEDYYFTSNEISGTIDIDVIKEASVDQIHLQIIGYEKVDFEDGKNEVKSFMNDKLIIAESGDFYPGSYSYPFEHLLPSEIPGCYAQQIRYTNKKVNLNITYEAVVTIAYQNGKEIKERREILIYEEPRKSKNIVSAKNKVIGDGTSIAIKIEADRDIYNLSDEIALISNILNETPKEISLITVKLLTNFKILSVKQPFETSLESYCEILSGVDPKMKDTRTIKFLIPNTLLPNTTGTLIQVKHL